MRVPTGRRAARLVAVAVVTLGLTPALQGHAWACSCATAPGAPPIEQQYRDAARTARLVYVGEVTAIRREGDTMTGVHHYTVRVDETLKGEHRVQRRLTGAANGGLCSIQLTANEPVLVVDRGGDALSLCGSLTTQHDVTTYAAIMRAALGPRLPRTGGAPPAVWVLLAAGGLLGLRRRPPFRSPGTRAIV